MRIDEPNGRRLDSWKEIAAYLGRHERTVIRWEKKMRLPVHRVPGGERQAVFAFTAELDAWLRREDSRELAAVPQGLKPNSTAAANGTTGVSLPRSFFQISPGGRRLSYYALAGLVTVCILLFALFGLRSRATGANVPVRVGFTLKSVQAFDEKDQLLWTHTYHGTLDASVLGQDWPLTLYSHIGDFRGNGDREVLVLAPIRPELNLEDPVQTEVDLFSGRGQLVWSYVPRGRFQFGKHDLSGPWMASELSVSPRAGRPQIWVAAIHLVWGNGFVVNLDPETGKDTLRYVNTGTIRTLNELKTPEGNFLLVGGFNNEADTASLAVIDEAKPFAASPQSEGTRHKCVSCPAGVPDYYFVFPRSEINEMEQVHEAAVVQLRVSGDQIEIRRNETNQWNVAQTHYTLKADHGLRVVSLRFGSGYDMLHRKLEREGKLDHSLENCPERLHPRPIKMWTPAAGWTEIRLEPSGASE